jgi:hypothetical protein
MSFYLTEETKYNLAKFVDEIPIDPPVILVIGIQAALTVRVTRPDAVIFSIGDRDFLDKESDMFLAADEIKPRQLLGTPEEWVKNWQWGKIDMLICAMENPAAWKDHCDKHTIVAYPYDGVLRIGVPEGYPDVGFT